MNCNRIIEFANGMHYGYHICSKKPFIEVQYSSAFYKLETITEILCKTHYNAFIKNIGRINKKTGFEFNLITKPIV